MRRIRILLFAVFCTVLLAAAGTAAADIMSWPELEMALHAGGTFSLGDDVTAYAHEEPIVILEGVTVTLDLNGHTIDRGLSEAVENGSVITVQGTLVLRDSEGGGRITGGFAQHGGGIYNAGTLVIEGGAVEGNCAVYDGGGIYNAGTLTMRAGTVTGNTAGRYGSGIHDAGTLKMEGTPVVEDNTSSNVYLPEGKRIQITGDMETGAHVGITSPAFVATFTEHYSDFLSYAPSVFFFSDVEGCTISQNALQAGNPDSYEGRWETIVTYLNVDREGRRISTVDANYTLLTSESRDLTDTWYVVRGHVSVNGRLNVQNGSVNIVLMDGAVLRANKGIYVGSGAVFSIYGQSGETGRLIATGSSNGAGIGGRDKDGYGTIYIHSGQVQATGASYGAGIGGGRSAANGNGMVTIFGGIVTAQGGEGGAGIGGGGNDSSSDSYGDPGRLVFYGGTVNATGGSYAAGIGSGIGGRNRGSIEIHSGVINVYGGVAGIGGGYGGHNDNVTVLITGGQVYAKGRYGGAGIGGGGGASLNAGSGCKVTITGGTVTAVSDDYAIGKGHNDWDNHHGTLSLFDLSWVKAGSSEANAIPVAGASRVSACRDSKYVKIEACPHENISYTIEAATHTGDCLNCLRGTVEEPHRYVEGTCEACGYQSPNWVIVFDPNGGTGTMTALEAAHGSSVPLPGCTFRAPDGMAFAEWRINGTGYPAGMSITPNSHLTAYAVWGESTWSLLQEQINNAGDRLTLILTADLAASESDAQLNVPGGKRVTLDLNGHTLSGSGVLGNVLYIRNGAELTLTDTAGGGAITGGKWQGINVESGGSFSMLGGEISACGRGLQIHGTAEMSGGAILNNTTNGGAVVYGSLTMTGGRLANNACTYGSSGGVTVYGTFRMTGGSITNNTGGYGGGIYVETAGGHLIMEGGSVTGNTGSDGGVSIGRSNASGSVAISGNASITGNTSKAGAAANLVINQDVYGDITPVTMTGSFGGRFGVTIRPYGNDDPDLSVPFTAGLNGRSIAGFFSDNAAYIVRLNGDGEAHLVDSTVLSTPDFSLPTGTLEIQSEAFAGTSAAVVYIPDGCGAIGAGAFRDCPNLRQVRIPAGCTIGENAFAGVYELRIFGYRNSPAETYCNGRLDCVFIPLD